MNTRMYELAKQAGFDGFEALDERNVKFAELIVRECVRYINKEYQRDFDTLWREDLTKSIKEHFGVE